MNKNRKDKKNKNLNEKNLNEKEIEKVSAGVSGEGRILDKLTPVKIAQLPLVAYGAVYPKPGKIVSLKEIQQKKKTSSPNEVKNLQPFPDENKDKN